MTKTLLALTLIMAAASANAMTWPWQDPAPVEPLQYCKGFVVGGLESKLVSGTSRTDLWLAWNYVIRSGELENVASNEYRTGLEQFQTAPDPATASAILQKADGECALGRSGYEVTGW